MVKARLVGRARVTCLSLQRSHKGTRVLQCLATPARDAWEATGRESGAVDTQLPVTCSAWRSCWDVPFVKMIGRFVPKGWPQFIVLTQLHGEQHAKQHWLLACAECPLGASSLTDDVREISLAHAVQ